MLNRVSGLQFDDTTERFRETRRRRSRRPLLAWLALSLALHLALLAALPEPAHDDRRAVTRVLDVVLQQDEPPLAPASPQPLQPAPRDDSALRQPLARAAHGTQKPQPAQAVLSAPATEAAGDALSAPGRLAVAAAPDRPEGLAAAAPPENEAPAAAAETAAISPPVFNAAYLRNPPPRYPLIARRNGEQGTVTLKVLVTRDGVPASVAVETSSGSPHLDSAALEAVRAWRFVPARRGSQPVEAWVLVPVVFRLEGAS